MTDLVLVFDLDDTLFLERDYVRSGFMHVGRVVESQYGVPGFGARAWQSFEAGVRGRTFDQVASELGLPPEAVPDLVAAYRDHEPDIALAPDAAEYLANLPAGTVHTGIVTDGYGPGQRRKLEALGLERLVDTVVVTAEHGPAWHKPSELAFRHIVAESGGRDARFVYFGDNPTKDFQGPASLGWINVRVRRPGGLHHAVHDQIPVDRTVTRFERDLFGVGQATAQIAVVEAKGAIA
ncbi:Haloacid dehalogenase domain protein hydrolase [Cellulomonas flavigena DSM 20109]|uniref:Haloacid dehalogenase domain protein hydrolase n=1 Tax=Cellulomonas flavigena (strain ATCC 482 / DSM 20109 / BCRC 11376 / JCM 18109 / NBRC 3775 / NCIMB 8073 / NRS 134) TaxID=446466 RepID=D5UJF3_CELFN|nr:HAD family hydrolase [Cellulomonas flavigena]ADG73676.1 Haloacid dehalogenase domain protein hydrolase [Cellulomonas flavigena DSM 20109]